VFKFTGDTALEFRRDVMQPLDQYLKDGAPAADTPPVLFYQTGVNRWQKLPQWPVAQRSRRSICRTASSWASRAARRLRRIRVRPGQAGAVRAASGAHGRWQCVEAVAGERPARRVRPHRRADLRHRAAETRVQIAGQPWSTCCFHQRHRCRLGGEADRRVSGRSAVAAGAGRLPAGHRDGYLPRPLPQQPGTPSPIPANEVQRYRFALPNANHVFLPGHRIMVQVQSSWFPLYDRNPQTYVPNIFYAKPADYQKATLKVFHNSAWNCRWWK
jgi:predicted acyl esterase